jgi:hypothetical protein
MMFYIVNEFSNGKIQPQRIQFYANIQRNVKILVAKQRDKLRGREAGKEQRTDAVSTPTPQYAGVCRVGVSY